ncbi:hypothetical protein [Cronobacter malonaticus]|uniref:hypothetical protein n=1 Tax=Cronobacter malonaticus TaxID=413503 RepID=UPI000A114495|nr:hypothetical protein [Cronobacter malonaticus]
MNKEFCFKIDKVQCDWAFKPIRSKVDVIEILMRVIKTILVYKEPKDEDVSGMIKLHVAKMNRIFFFSEKKYYSISFPFTVECGDLGFSFRNKDIDEIDSLLTSEVISLINDKAFSDVSIYGFIDPLLTLIESKERPYFWSFLKTLLTFEDGYIRYDVDEDRENGKLHPLYHFDIFYSNGPTFKVGLDKHCSNDTMVDILNIETDCFYFKG